MRGHEPYQEEEGTYPDPRAVRSLREARRMSRAELALKAGLARETIGRIERARRPIRARRRTILRLARALKVNPRDLVLDAPEERRPR